MNKRKDNKAIISIGLHKINHQFDNLFYYSDREPICTSQGEGVFTEIELPDIDDDRPGHGRMSHWCCTQPPSSILSNRPPRPPKPTVTEQDYIDFIKKANDRVGRDVRSMRLT